MVQNVCFLLGLSEFPYSWFCSAGYGSSLKETNKSGLYNIITYVLRCAVCNFKNTTFERTWKDFYEGL